MRKFFGFVVLCGVLGGVIPGCAVDASEPSTPQASQYGFTRDSSGQAKQADTASLENFTSAQEFEHALASGGEQAVTDTESAAASCSGACNANTCVCSGDLDCCIIGCVLCWEVVN